MCDFLILFGVFNCGLGVNDSSGILWRLQILGVEVYYFVGFYNGVDLASNIHGW
jgi:hypothetical protein